MAVAKSKCQMWFAFAFLCFCQRADSDTLELVQVLFRHGDRAPNSPFPNDVNNDYWSQNNDGYGQLTNIGKQQHKALGQYMRQRYNGFLNASYNHLEFTIRSSTVDRCLMSAYCNLAGLYPPVDQQVWNANIPWQPIPVHTQPQEYDRDLTTDPPCPKFDYLFDKVKKSPEVVAIDLENKYLYEYVTNQTGANVTDMYSLDPVTDALVCDQCHGLPWPSWVPSLWDRMTYLHDTTCYYQYGLPQLARLKGGPLLGTVVQNMKAKQSGLDPTMKAYWFSSHDSVVAAFLTVLGVFNNRGPPYASTVILELHKDTSNAYNVQIYYKNDTTAEPFPLTVPNCTFQCPLDKFVNLTADMVPENIVEECNLIPSTLPTLDKLPNISKRTVD